VTNTGTTLVSDLVFDLNDGGFTSLTAGTVVNYVLFYRSLNSRNWTVAATASSVSGDQITFPDFNFSGNAQDDFYTIAHLNNGVSLLSMELLYFDARLNNSKVDIYWTTTTEINNNCFTIEHFFNGQDWISIQTVSRAGNSTQQLNYNSIDHNPLVGISYYRLKQTDFEGMFKYLNFRVTKSNALEVV
jgi:hypothetical protein